MSERCDNPGCKKTVGKTHLDSAPETRRLDLTVLLYESSAGPVAQEPLSFCSPEHVAEFFTKVAKKKLDERGKQLAKAAAHDDPETPAPVVPALTDLR